MEESSYGRMASSDAPNPLRPYYKPPSIGIPEFNSSQSPGPPSPPFGPRRSGPSSNRDFKELFSELDYGDYFSSGGPTVAEMAKTLFDRTVWNYTSTVMAQPFEVAKIVLQCYDAGAVVTPDKVLVEAKRGSQRDFFSDTHDESESDEDTPSYFVPTTPDETPTRKAPKRNPLSRTHSTASSINNHHSTHSPPSSSPNNTTTTTTTTLVLTSSDSVMEVITQLWSKEGAFGVWKATNSTFIYGILLRTIETWTRSCLSAILNIPDPAIASSAVRAINGPNILDSLTPLTSITVIVLAAGISGFVLAPIDMVRTRLILTPTSSSPRTLLPSLKALPSLSCPPQLLPITLLHSTLPPLVSTTMPFFFRGWFNIDPIISPTLYSLSSFFVQLSEIFVKLPLETVLRRGHMANLLGTSTPQPPKRGQPSPLLPLHTSGLGLSGNSKIKTIVPIGPYKGVFGTLLHIVHEEGRKSTTPPSSIPSTPRSQSAYSSQTLKSTKRPTAQREKRGQGWSGTVRGWRVGFWALIGIYATAGLSNSGGMSEF